MAILVTGGATGIGRAVAERFAPGPTDVFVAFRDSAAAAAETAAAIAERGGRAHAIRCDVADVEEVRALAAEIGRHVERLDQIVHCAVKAVGGPLLEAPPRELEAAVAVNALALVHLVREALPLLGEGSSVFYLTSRGGRRVLRDYGPVGITKAMGDHIVRQLAVELAPRGIRVNAVSPGAIDTPALRAMFPDTHRERIAASERASPAGRRVEAVDVANAIALLAAPELSLVQGQTIAVDGGAALC